MGNIGCFQFVELLLFYLDLTLYYLKDFIVVEVFINLVRFTFFNVSQWLLLPFIFEILIKI
jgi:hypothetical protein